MHNTSFLPERDKAREEHYAPGDSGKEPFGLNKRTRRQAKGMRVTLPNGKFPEDTK